MVLIRLALALLFVGVGSAQEVALTFDDLPSHGALPPGETRVDVIKSFVKTLRKADGPAPYGFINAAKVEADPSSIEVLKIWREGGFPLGNHAYSHMNLHANSVEAFTEDIAKNEPTLDELMAGEDWHWFRYPFLREGDTLEKRRAVRAYLEERHYRVAQVTLDYEDYAWNGPYARCSEKNDEEAIAGLKSSYLETASEYVDLGREMARMIYGRDIKHVLLLHVGAFGAEIMPDLLELLKRKGFKLITLEDAQTDSAYASDPNIPMNAGITLLEQMMIARKLETPPHRDKPFDELKALCR